MMQVTKNNVLLILKCVNTYLPQKRKSWIKNFETIYEKIHFRKIVVGPQLFLVCICLLTYIYIGRSLIRKKWTCTIRKEFVVKWYNWNKYAFFSNQTLASTIDTKIIYVGFRYSYWNVFSDQSSIETFFSLVNLGLCLWSTGLPRGRGVCFRVPFRPMAFRVSATVL